jgi:hypothetical protein
MCELENVIDRSAFDVSWQITVLGVCGGGRTSNSRSLTLELDSRTSEHSRGMPAKFSASPENTLVTSRPPCRLTCQVFSYEKIE